MQFVLMLRLLDMNFWQELLKHERCKIDHFGTPWQSVSGQKLDEAKVGLRDLKNWFHCGSEHRMIEKVFLGSESDKLSVGPSLANIYLFKVNNGNTRRRCKICSKLTIKDPKRRQWHRSSIFIVNFEHILHLFLVFL